MIRFEIPGTPIPQKRPRVVKNRAYDPSSLDKREIRKIILAQFRSQGVLARLYGSIAVNIVFCYPWPKKTQHKPNMKVFCPKYADLDNLAKFYLDVMNELIYQDDRQIVILNTRKLYGDEAKVLIEIEELCEDANPQMDSNGGINFGQAQN